MVVGVGTTVQVVLTGGERPHYRCGADRSGR